MALENWISGAEMHAIATIVKEMDDRKMYLGELGGDVLRIPMAKLKKAGYNFLGCDMQGDYSDMNELRGSFQKLVISPEDTEESISALAAALVKVLKEIAGPPHPAEIRPESKRCGPKIYPF